MGVEKAMQKTCENHPKNHPKSMPKPSKNLQKTDAKKELKNRGPFAAFPGRPGETRAPTNTYKSTRHIRPLKKDTYREAHAERPTSTL